MPIPNEWALVRNSRKHYFCLGYPLNRRMRKLFSALTSLLLVLTFISGCASGYPNVREEADNQALFKGLYFRLVKLCDGKSRLEHEACVARINKEAYARYADRNNSQITKDELMRQIQSAVVYGAVSVAVTEAVSPAVSSSSSGSSSRSRARACYTTSTQTSYAINTGGFIVIPITCN